MIWDWDDDGYYTKYDMHRDYIRGLESEATYDDLDVIYEDDDLPEDVEIELPEVEE